MRDKGFLRQIIDQNNKKSQFDKSNGKQGAKGFLGMDKGNKPSRFNEDVETTSMNSLKMSEYLD